EVGCFICNATSDLNHPHVVDRDDLTLTMLNKFPYNSGHVMVASNRHVANLSELTGDEPAAVIAALSRATQAITAAMHPEGFNIGINQGRVAGGSVEHLHVHVVPRWQGDTNYMPVIGDTKVLPEYL